MLLIQSASVIVNAVFINDIVNGDIDSFLISVIIFSLKTYVRPWNDVPTTIKQAPKNTFLPNANESTAVNDNPNTTRVTPVHCNLDSERESKNLEYIAAQMVTEE